MTKLVTMNSPIGKYELYGRTDDNSIIGAISQNKGNYEPSILKCITRYCETQSVIIDIGANIGALTVFFSKIANEGQVISIEPGSENFRYLNKNIEHNACDNVKALNFGIANYNGKAIFNYVPSVAACSFISTSGVKEGCQEEVQMLTLDQLLYDIHLSRIDLIKLDVEGGELDALKGARTTIETFNPKLLIEWNPATMKRFYDTSGEELYEFISRQWKEISLIKSDGSLVQVDSYATLKSLADNGKGWEDLLCIN